jgi:hypothetical protein
MSRFTRGGSILATVVTALAVLPGTTSADPPARFHDHSSQTFEFNLCGISGEGTLVSTSNLISFADGSSRVTYSSKATYTNPLNGRSVRLASAGQQISGQSIVDDQAGTVTVVFSTAGLYQRIQTGHGAVILRDAGLITTRVTFDLETGEVISRTTVINGPHPQQDPEFDFDAFCEIITDALA